jgi:hypothetical protein
MKQSRLWRTSREVPHWGLACPGKPQADDRLINSLHCDLMDGTCLFDFDSAPDLDFELPN